MRPLRTAPWVLVFTCALATVACADDFSDFRIPAHRRSRLGLALDGSFSQASEDMPGFFLRNGGGNGDLQGFAAWRGDRDPREWDVALQGACFVDASHDAAERFQPQEIPPSRRSRYHELQAFENWSVQAGMRAYPGARPFGFEARAMVAGNDEQQWFNDTEISRYDSSPVLRDELHRHEEAWLYREFAQVDAAIGVGRVRDATPVFEAILLEERLFRDHVLARSPSAAARQRLAELFALRGSFSLVHDQPDKSFWKEVERLLREDGALADGGDAFAWMHANEKLQVARSFERDCGFFVGPVLSARHTHQIVRQESANGYRSFSDDVPVSEFLSRDSRRDVTSLDQTFYGIRGEYHRPIGDRSQVDVEERALIDLKGEPDAFEVAGRLGLGRLVGERWFLSAFFQHARSIQNRGPDVDSWSLVSGGAIEMFLEDFVRLQLNVTERRQRQHSDPVVFPIAPPFPGPFTSSDTRFFHVSLAVVVARGSLTAPGLGVRERPLRP